MSVTLPTGGTIPGIPITRILILTISIITAVNELSK